jgi:hypothetical protein
VALEPRTMNGLSVSAVQCIVGHMAGFVSLHEKRFWQHVAGIVDIKVSELFSDNL